MLPGFFVTITAFCFGTYLATAETVQQSNEPTLEVHNFNLRPKEFMPMPDTWEINPNLNSMWSYRPESIQSRNPGEYFAREVLHKPPHAVTKLAKSLNLGYDPHFDKGFFEPFERRQRPMTLIRFRKNGLLPKIEIEGFFEPFERRQRPMTLIRFRKNGLLPKIEIESSTVDTNIAELQSPYNEISSFWGDEPGSQRMNI